MCQPSADNSEVTLTYVFYLSLMRKIQDKQLLIVRDNLAFKISLLVTSGAVISHKKKHVLTEAIFTFAIVLSSNVMVVA